MNNKLRKSMAIVSLIFMVLFAVSLVLCCVDITMFNNSIGLIALFTGFVGISVFAVIRLSSRNTPENPPEEGADSGQRPDGDSERQPNGQSKEGETGEPDATGSTENGVLSEQSPRDTEGGAAINCAGEGQTGAAKSKGGKAAKKIAGNK